MAHIHTKRAGQWAKRKSNNLFGRMLAALVVGAAVWGIFVGVCFARFSFTVGSVVFFLGSCGLWAASKPLFRRLERSVKERINYLRGGQAEGLVAWYLHDLPGGWHVFHNLPCADGGDIDHVAVGPGGLFAVSTKSYKGHVTRKVDGTVLMNGRPLAPELDEALGLGMWVHRYLKASMGAGTPWVQPVLALPLAKVDTPPTELKVWILDEEALLAQINPDEPVTNRLSGKCVEAVAAALERITVH